jgi:hypothetical protein
LIKKNFKNLIFLELFKTFLKIKFIEFFFNFLSVFLTVQIYIHSIILRLKVTIINVKCFLIKMYFLLLTKEKSYLFKAKHYPKIIHRLVEFSKVLFYFRRDYFFNYFFNKMAFSKSYFHFSGRRFIL